MTRRPVLALPAVAAALCLTVAACGGGHHKAAPPPSTPAATTASPSGPYEPKPTTSPSPSSRGGAEDDSLVNRAADQAAKDGASRAALATAKVWVQGKSLDQSKWNAALMQTLSPVARPAYDGRFWGYRIKATKVTGTPALTDATMTTATVAVPTNTGTLTMTVTRADESSPWLTTSIVDKKTAH